MKIDTINIDEIDKQIDKQLTELNPLARYILEKFKRADSPKEESIKWFANLLEGVVFATELVEQTEHLHSAIKNEDINEFSHTLKFVVGNVFENEEIGNFLGDSSVYTDIINGLKNQSN